MADMTVSVSLAHRCLYFITLSLFVQCLHIHLVVKEVMRRTEHLYIFRGLLLLLYFTVYWGFTCKHIKTQYMDIPFGPYTVWTLYTLCLAYQCSLQ